MSSGLYAVNINCLYVTDNDYLFAGTDEHGIYRSVKTTAVAAPDNAVIRSLLLDQNYPNPFNAETRIQYHLPERAHVKLQIVDLHGRVINVLVNEMKRAGPHLVRWDGSDENGKIVPSGIYLCSGRLNNQRITRKITLLK